MTTLVLGPVRSGKSTRGAALARAGGKRVVFAATAAVDPSDAEMVARVARHRLERPAEWTVVETAHERSLESVLADADANTCVLVDALGTWLAALMLEDASPAYLESKAEELTVAVAATKADVILIAEETGWGVVPQSALGRAFRDALGRLTQRLAARADRVELIVAGFAVDLRNIGVRVSETSGG